MSAAAAVVPPGSPTYRVPIQVVRSCATQNTSPPASSNPNFLLCLIDHLLTRDQRAAQLAHLKDNSAPNPTSSQPELQPVASQRPVHDRLPVAFVVRNRVKEVSSTSAESPSSDPNAAATASLNLSIASTATSSSSSSSLELEGVSCVTLVPLSEEEAWLQSRSDEDRKHLHSHHVPLAHAARCPCREPLLSADAEVFPDITGKVLPVLRLAVVVVPTVLSVLHCPSCSPSSPPCPPLPRVLVTRRPRKMRAFPGCWVFPGGACDAEDRSLECTGVREVKEETGLAVRPESMRMVGLWEAVYPVLKPRFQADARFQAKARYVIAMFAGQVEHGAREGETQRHGGSAPHIHTPPAASSSTLANPICLSCSLPLALCPEEVDASVWLTGAQFDELRRHARYFHTEDESALQQVLPNNSQQEKCGAGKEECQCEWIPAQITKEYAEQHKKQAHLKELPPNSTPPSTSFFPAEIRSCTLYGLYPNEQGSGMAEGHMVALEEMREQGLF